MGSFDCLAIVFLENTSQEKVYCIGLGFCVLPTKRANKIVMFSSSIFIFFNFYCITPTILSRFKWCLHKTITLRMLEI